MDNRVSVEGHEPMSSLSLASRSLRVIALAALAALAACGGGGGGGDGNPPPPPPPVTGQIAATVVDQFDAPINGVTITASIDGTTHTATTGSAGTATVTQVPAGSVSVTASAEGLVDPPAQTVTVTENGTANVEFTMERVVEAAGGISKARVEDPLTDGSTLTFRIGVIVIDQNFNPVPGLTASAFTFADCTPQPEFPERPDCVRFGSPGDDAPYTVANATPAEFQEIADPPGPVPYAAGLLFDSSESMADSDPTDARIFATKEYLNDVVTPDLVMLAAFADQAARQLPNEGVNYFPCAPCTPSFTSDGNSLFASLDSLATLEGGGTPLYDSLATSDGQTGMIISVNDEAPTTPANLRKAVVLFSDGQDIYCNPEDGSGSFAQCNQRRAEVVAEGVSRQVDIFTIGLSSENLDSLAMAELALRNGGAYLFAERPTQLRSIFGILDRLLADDMPTYEMVWTVNAAAGTLIPGRALIGELTVETGATTLTLPLVVQIQQP
jgi:Carboxypeptidase regulatory-like domain